MAQTMRRPESQVIENKRHERLVFVCEANTMEKEAENIWRGMFIFVLVRAARALASSRLLDRAEFELRAPRGMRKRAQLS